MRHLTSLWPHSPHLKHFTSQDAQKSDSSEHMHDAGTSCTSAADAPFFPTVSFKRKMGSPLMLNPEPLSFQILLLAA